MQEKTRVLPDVIVLFGSIGAGKGTQMHSLKKAFGGTIIDNGAAFRAFAEYRSQDSHPDQQRAQQVYDDMVKGPIKTEDMFYILEQTIIEALDDQQLVIMDKPGGILPVEMKWFFNLLAEQGKSVVLVNLHIPVEIAIERIRSRYYLPGSSKTYITRADALESAKDGEVPYQRSTDADQTKIENRYKTMYADLVADLRLISNTYGIKIHDIDGNGEIDDIFEKLVYTIGDNKNFSYPCKT